MLGNLVYLYLLSPLHTGGTTQEGNLLGIARESHTNLPYVPSSTVRGKFRSITGGNIKNQLWGNTIEDVTGNSNDTNLTQGNLWIGDASILWLPVPSLSHGVVWVSSPLLLQRWSRLNGKTQKAPEYSNNFASGKPVYLKDAILKSETLKAKSDLSPWIPQSDIGSIDRALVLPDHHCATLIQMSLWRQVKIKLDEHKTVDGGFRYEEAIPPDTLMYFPWGVTSQSSNEQTLDAEIKFKKILTDNAVVQIGGQESLGRGFVQQWSGSKEEVAV
jgi:CRISPR-associated protein Cmr4